ncbi:MAG TPA: class I SAM-dependent methyltransferase [Thermoplasmata archaeon]
MTAKGAFDASEWLARWDRQQEGYVPSRDRRFEAMFDVLEAQLPPAFHALDLAAGPGSLSARLLRRFPKARVTAVDFDPVLLHIGRHAHPAVGGRLNWLDADLRTPDWSRTLKAGSLDAVLSTTALHWLPAPTLARLYRDLGPLVRTKGVFLNGDYLPSDAEPTALRGIGNRVHDLREERLFEGAQRESWDEWWARLESETSLAGLFEERRRRFPTPHGGEAEVSFETHAAALRSAGFDPVGVVWQEFSDRIILAVR